MNARNGKSMSKIPEWPSLRLLAFKSEFIRQFEFLENLEYNCGKCCNLLNFLQIQTGIKSHSLMPGASNLAILMFPTCFFHFWHF